MRCLAGRLCKTGFALALTGTLSGCGAILLSNGTGSASSAMATKIQGRVFGGQQPIHGAAVMLYQAGASGPATGAVSLLSSPVFTGSDGSFDITGGYTCPTSTTQVYLVTHGGNPGLPTPTDNQAATLMAALGDCGSLFASTFINVNEVTTVAAVWALQQFLGPGAMVGASATNALGLRNAFLIAANLVNISTGLAPGASLPAGATVESSKLYTLADALATCVNSDGNNARSPLFSAAAVNGSQAANTVDAALNIVLHPGSHVLSVFNLAPTQGPFQPTLTRAPNDWTMSITYTGAALNHPTALAIDSTGSVWAANYFGAAATKLSAAGIPAATAGFPDASLEQSYGITIDASDNAWITNQQSSAQTNNGNGSITKFTSSGQSLSGTGFTSGGIYYPTAIAADARSGIWVVDYGRSGATRLAVDGSSLSGSAGFGPTSLAFPTAVALDAAGNAWFAAQAAAVQVTSAGVATSFSCCNSAAGIAVDQAGNIWVSDYYASALVELSSSGAVLQQITSSGGIFFPQTVAIDGAGKVWLTNYHGNSISAFRSSPGGSSSSAPSPPNGFGGDASLTLPFGLAIDNSGDVWVANSGSNTLTQLVGLASPIRTPLLGPPAQP